MWRRVPCPPSQRHHVAAIPQKKGQFFHVLTRKKNSARSAPGARAARRRRAGAPHARRPKRGELSALVRFSFWRYLRLSHSLLSLLTAERALTRSRTHVPGDLTTHTRPAETSAERRAHSLSPSRTQTRMHARSRAHDRVLYGVICYLWRRERSMSAARSTRFVPRLETVHRH